MCGRNIRNTGRSPYHRAGGRRLAKTVKVKEFCMSDIGDDVVARFDRPTGFGQTSMLATLVRSRSCGGSELRLKLLVLWRSPQRLR